LSQGKVVICDRFAESALVYQGICRNLGLTQVEALNKFATNGLRPDKIFLLDIPEKMGLARVQKRLGSQQLDRMEQEGLAFHKQVRNGFLKLSKKEPKRFVVLDALLEAEEIEKRIRETLIPIIKKKNLCRH
jgi:dTMP kinase